jgi:acetoin utilization protein AcuB
MLARNRMSKRLVTVGPEDSVANARALLEKYGIHHLPVVKDQRLVGIVTDRDVRSAPSKTKSVATIMTSKPLVIDPDTFVDEAARRLRRHRIGALPVVEHGRLVGILTVADVLDAFVDLSGVREATTQIVIAEAKGSKAADQVRDIVRKSRGEIKWLHRDAKDPSRLFVRLKAPRTDDIEYALEAAGFTVDAIIGSSRATTR